MPERRNRETTGRGKVIKHELGSEKGGLYELERGVEVERRRAIEEDWEKREDGKEQRANYR